MKVTFIGMGTMGAPMAHNLLKAGHEVTVHNRTRNKKRRLPQPVPGGPRLQRKPPKVLRSSLPASATHPT